MNKRILSGLLALCLALFCAAPAVAAERSITVSNAHELIKLSENCVLDTYSAGLTVDLTCDIDLTGFDFTPIPVFSGIFNGNGYTIYGIKIDYEGSACGLFRYIEEGATVRGLNLKGEICPEGSRNTVGGIAGVNLGTIEDCSFEGTVTGADKVGGIAGENKLTGIITGCRTFGEVTGNHFIGGIAGDNIGVIRSCRNDAAINTKAAQNKVELSDISFGTLTSSESANTVTDVGGIAGSTGGVIRECDNYGGVGYRLMGYNIGGIAGSQRGYITKCRNYGDVSGRKEVGGIVGHAEPVTVVEYTEDVLQVLEGQVNTLGALTSSAAANAQKGASQITGQIAVLEGHTEVARDAIEILTPAPGEDAPDADTILAAQNNLTESINAMPGVVDGIAQAAGDTVSGVSRDLQAVSNQVNAMGETIGAASENLGVSITDISDNDTDEDYLGKIERCENYGRVLGDGNVGGIAGAIAYENDLDPEGDVDVYGSLSMNFSGEIRAVIKYCDNMGEVTVKKQNGGGIVGWQSLGLVRECLNTGELSCENASYVGGIAGTQSGFMRHCSARCVITGSSYVGGIAGIGETVTDCRSMIRLTADEKYGIILGYANEIPRADDEEGTIKRNYYLVVDSDMGGIDGISYEGCAQSLKQTEFFALTFLEPVFRTVSVRFVFEDGTSETVRITPGRAMSEDRIPEIPEKDGCTAYWDGLDEVDLSNVRFDATVYAKYNRGVSVFESEERIDGKPAVLVQGQFGDRRSVVLEEPERRITAEKGEIIAEYKFDIEGGRAEKLRCYIGKDFASKNLTVFVTDESGSSREVVCETEGSYVTFEIDENDCGFAVLRQLENYTVEMATGAGALVVIALIIILTVRKKKKAAVSKLDKVLR